MFSNPTEFGILRAPYCSFWVEGFSLCGVDGFKFDSTDHFRIGGFSFRCDGRTFFWLDGFTFELTIFVSLIGGCTFDLTVSAPRLPRPLHWRFDLEGFSVPMAAPLFFCLDCSEIDSSVAVDNQNRNRKSTSKSISRVAKSTARDKSILERFSKPIL